MHGHILLRRKGLSVEIKITRLNGLETNIEDNVRTCLRSLFLKCKGKGNFRISDIWRIGKPQREKSQMTINYLTD